MSDFSTFTPRNASFTAFFKYIQKAPPVRGCKHHSKSSTKPVTSFQLSIRSRPMLWPQFGKDNLLKFPIRNKEAVTKCF